MKAALTIDPPRSRKPRGQGASRPAEILAAAQRLFLEVGFEQATMRRIAAAVGVSPTALYVYYPDKEHILRAIAESTFGDLLETLEEATAGPHASVVEELRAGMRAYVAFGRSRPDAYRLTFMSRMTVSFGPGRPANICEDLPAADRSFAKLVDLAAALVAERDLRPGDPLLAAEALWACMHGVTILLIDRPDILESDPDVLADAVIDTAIAGLLASANRASHSK
jgi:AcrR family transcriptional regulator